MFKKQPVVAAASEEVSTPHHPNEDPEGDVAAEEPTPSPTPTNSDPQPVSVFSSVFSRAPIPPGLGVISHSKHFQKPPAYDITTGCVRPDVCWMNQPIPAYPADCSTW